MRLPLLFLHIAGGIVVCFLAQSRVRVAQAIFAVSVSDPAARNAALLALCVRFGNKVRAQFIRNDART